MTIRKANKLALCLGLVGLLTLQLAAQEEASAAQDAPATPEAEASTPQEKKNPRRAETYDDAAAAAGEDGVIVFCYGPDWNQRSVRMLKNFWKRPAVEQATGGAILVAVPFYQDPTPEQREERSRIAGSSPEPRNGICPSILMVDQVGNVYCNLSGTDDLGGEDGALALKNMREKLEAYRKSRALMAQAENLRGVEKAKVLGQIAELPIKAPADLIEQIRQADPNDSTGLVRRNTHDAKLFLYKQMGTTDGFISEDFIPDLKQISAECMKVVNDTALRTSDRQAAYSLIIGLTMKKEGGGKKMRDLINACMKIDPNTPYGRLSGALANKWGSQSARRSSEERKQQRKHEAAKEKEHRASEREDKRNARNMDIN